MVVDLICLIDLHSRKLILLPLLILVDIRLLQVLHLVLMNAACVVYLNSWLRDRERKISEIEKKKGMISLRENCKAEDQHFSGRQRRKL
jgi:hypothetical protein